ncbi:MAG: hypothetical protein ABIN94_20210 [Ferruginibacter sp.]
MCNCNQSKKLSSELEDILNEENENSLGFETGHPAQNRNSTRHKLSAGKAIPGTNTIIYPDRTFGYIFHTPQSSVSNELNEIEGEVYDPDKRKAIVNTLRSPYRWICRLELDFNGRKGIGTGTLISPRHILTCGHNLFNNIMWGGAPREATAIKVSPGYNCAGKIAAPFGHSFMSKVNYHDNWKTGLNGQYDYGLITLNSAIGKKQFEILGGKPLGFWGEKVNGDNTRIIPQTTVNLKDKSFNISGYPGDKCCYLQLAGKDVADLNPDPHKKRINPNLFGDCSTLLSGTRYKGDPFQMWGGAQFSSFGKITNPSPAGQPRLILYDLDTFPGHSGSPLWVRWQQYRNLIAIHTGSFPPTNNRGIRITEEVMKQVRAWM